MQTIKFDILIPAAPDLVWKKMWDPEGYKIWTSPFFEGSYYQCDQLAQGNKIHFLSPQGDGLCSLIERLEPNKFIGFKHLCEIKKHQETIPDPKKDKWVGARETYSLNKQNAGTKLSVTTETEETYKDYMEKAFPVALQKVRELCETK